jgi:GDP-D-mannose dehydratase
MNMHLIINNDVPDDFVVSTMTTHSVREMVEWFNLLEVCDTNENNDQKSLNIKGRFN